MTRVRTGGCLCGAVRFELEGEPFLIGVCHCADCRKESGSAFTFYAKWPRAAFRVTGETRRYAGAISVRLAVRVCSISMRPTLNCASAASTRHDHDRLPSQEGWIKRRETWLKPIEGASQSIEDTPS